MSIAYYDNYGDHTPLITLLYTIYSVETCSNKSFFFVLHASCSQLTKQKPINLTPKQKRKDWEINWKQVSIQVCFKKICK